MTWIELMLEPPWESFAQTELEVEGSYAPSHRAGKLTFRPLRAWLSRLVVKMEVSGNVAVAAVETAALNLTRVRSGRTGPRRGWP